MPRYVANSFEVEAVKIVGVSPLRLELANGNNVADTGQNTEIGDFYVTIPEFHTTPWVCKRLYFERYFTPKSLAPKP